MASTKLLQSGIETYTGRVVADLKRFDDPIVAGAVALRATMEDGKTIDFLVSANSGPLKTPDNVADALEECDFGAWPPKVGTPKFF